MLHDRQFASLVIDDRAALEERIAGDPLARFTLGLFGAAAIIAAVLAVAATYLATAADAADQAPLHRALAAEGVAPRSLARMARTSSVAITIAAALLGVVGAFVLLRVVTPRHRGHRDIDRAGASPAPGSGGVVLVAVDDPAARRLHRGLCDRRPHRVARRPRRPAAGSSDDRARRRLRALSDARPPGRRAARPVAPRRSVGARRRHRPERLGQVDARAADHRPGAAERGHGDGARPRPGNGLCRGRSWRCSAQASG